ncbi:MAG: DNA-binding response regulator [Chloroflexi bacterium]|nr:MAG: DNA-binding response regulator [Chloroflexota bacterium]
MKANRKPIRILIADDHPLVRNGMRTLLSTQPDLEFVGEAENGAKAVKLARKLQPDIILLDLVMPQMDGLEALAQIKEDNPNARVLVVTSFADDEKVFPAIKGGALGYFLKEASPCMLAQAIRDVHQGELWLHPTIARKVIGELDRPPQDLPPTKEPLTQRELEVLKLIARGLTNPEIATELGISAGTVRFHVSNILSKLHLANRTQAALYALQEGLSDSN